jgi:saccharopine dehydrogenase-like NADP-dependent oxidoreductase
MAVNRILILGGYGNFGKRIAENLVMIPGLTLVIAGRDHSKASDQCLQLVSMGAKARTEPALIDTTSLCFRDELAALKPDLVIHTGGPFQGQDYRVPTACIAAGSHYIDLADDRRFVCDIRALNDEAIKNKVLLVSGASSVPGLSSAVIDSFVEQFTQLEAIDFAIAPGNRAERGEATVKGILSYTGHPFSVFSRGQWVNQYGWMSPRKLFFNKVIGKRWLANVDVPDLELFPQRYDSVYTVNFQAGLELPFLHFGMVFMALLAKMGLVKNWSVLSRWIFKSSEIFRGLGTDIGGMQINLTGLGANREPKRIKWTLCAERGVGPYIPTLSAIILAKKLINDSLEDRGAMPCLGLYSLREFDCEASKFGIYHHTEISPHGQ